MLTGITISKPNILTHRDRAELESYNIGIRETRDSYILYYKPQSYTEDQRWIKYIKWLFASVRSSKIYNMYNDDFGNIDI